MNSEMVTLFGNGVSVEVSSSFFSYRADSDLVLSVDEKGEGYYRIMHLGEHVGVYVHASSGKICAGPNTSHLLFGNSTISHFVQCMQEVADSYPWYGEDPKVDELIKAERDLEAIIQKIDPPAARETTFWANFISDVRMGCYED
ncbi:hypothetical protein OG866_44445 [Streptomyces sp. NBC_00663]|uniref:hypothetical protein n=1 Tax=Streptomyces sp. NBC_00663 TaxID=2975801 RepID=UPI002E2FE274|nr:hypothetical protein [Streptomyces sp. NBC_00663]